MAACIFVLAFAKADRLSQNAENLNHAVLALSLIHICILVFRPGGRLSWFGAAGEDKVCGARSRSVKCIALLSSAGPR